MVVGRSVKGQRMDEEELGDGGGEESSGEVEEEEEKGEEEERQEWWWEEVSKISGWTKKNWVMAAVKKAVARWKLLTTMRAGRRRTAELEVVDSKGWSRFREAEKETLKAVQQKAFGRDIRQMKEREMNVPDSRKELRKKLRKEASSLRPHNPFIDQDGVVRVGSRLVHAQIHPQIL